MTIRTVFTLEHPALRQKTRKTKVFGPKLQQLVDDMLETMRAEPGIGLAANQIGIPQRVIVVELPEDDEDPQSGKTFAIANPKIIKASREMEEMEEGCLSVPGLVGEVWRSTEIVVKGQDVQGKPLRVKARDMLARVLQHEIDHLEGILYIDRVESPDKIRPIGPRESVETNGDSPETEIEPDSF
jgi:peptide deformylase